MMEHLYAPWRNAYVQEQVHGKQETTTAQECIFCECAKQSDDDCYILYRAKAWFVILNRFPYNAGHLLIVSYNHTSTLTSMSKEDRYELSDLVQMCTEVLHKELAPQGINIGMNIGRASGAGIPSHIHQHVLPRWLGDTNFLPVLAETKHISCDLNGMYKKLKESFSRL